MLPKSNPVRSFETGLDFYLLVKYMIKFIFQIISLEWFKPHLVGKHSPILLCKHILFLGFHGSDDMTRYLFIDLRWPIISFNKMIALLSQPWMSCWWSVHLLGFGSATISLEERGKSDHKRLYRVYTILRLIHAGVSREECYSGSKSICWCQRAWIWGRA